MRTYEFTISHHLATAIINDDYSGIDEYDELAVDKWLEDYGIEWIAPAPSYEKALRNGEEPTRFDQCEITGLGYDCIDIIAYKQ